MTSEACRFDAAIDAIYATATEPSGWPGALQAIADCFADVGAVLLYQRDDRSLGTIISPGLSTAAQREYEQAWWHRDIRSTRALERGFVLATDAVTDRHVVTAEEIETHPIYTEFLIPNGMGWFAGVGICPDPSRLVWISVQRASTKAPFTDLELGLLARIGQHAERALRLGIRLIDAELTRETLSAALARLDVAVFLIDGAGRVVFNNTASQRFVGDGLMVEADLLLARFEPDRRALQSAVSAVLDREPGGPNRLAQPVLVHGRDPERILAAYVLPVFGESGIGAERVMASARVCVLCVAYRSGDAADPALVRDLLGLTLGEARVAALVAAGLAPRGAAELLGITEHTARTTLKHVFAKVGVSRQSELAALLSKLVLR